MALINCPECNKQISDKANLCIHCGCPLESIKLKKVVLIYCDGGENGFQTSEFIESLTGLSFEEVLEFKGKINDEKNPQVVVDGINNSIANEIVDIFSSLGAKTEIRNSEESVENKIIISYKKPVIPNTPKCPTCGSTDIMKIGTLDRIAAVALIGLASSNIGKSFYCKKCKYKW